MPICAKWNPSFLPQQVGSNASTSLFTLNKFLENIFLQKHIFTLIANYPKDVNNIQGWPKVFFFLFWGGLYVFLTPPLLPRVPLSQVPCVPANSLIPPRLRGWVTHGMGFKHTPLPLVILGTCRCGWAPGENH